MSGNRTAPASSSSNGSRYAVAPPSNPFVDVDADDYGNDDDEGDSSDGEGGTTAGGGRKDGIVELWDEESSSVLRYDDPDDGRYRRQHHGSGGGNNNGSFEMIPVDDYDDDYEGFDDYDEDEDDEEDDGLEGHRRVVRRRQRYRPRLPLHTADDGDDYSTSGTILPKGLYHYLHPPNVPRTVQLYRLENVAVPTCYLLVGLLQGLSGPFTNVYPLDLGASEAQQATLSSLKSLPASFKLLFGFLSDNVPLCGYRRKSYMLLGWGITSASMFALLFFSDLSAEAAASHSSSSSSSAVRHDDDIDDDDDATRRALDNTMNGSIVTVVGEPPSVPFLSVCLLLFGTGFWFADVMGDSIVAEKAKFEPETSRGQLQSTCYACRFFGLMIAAPCGTVIYSSFGPRALVLLMAILPACIVPLVFVLGETRNANVSPPGEQCREIWNTVCSRAVWQPMGFVYLYNVLQVGNVAWKQFLKTVLNFTSNQLNSLLVVAYVLLWLGIMAYKRFFIHWSWRTVYVLTTLLNGLFSSLQILLIKGKTFGLSPFLFALGDDAFADFIAGIQFLPTTIMMVHLCPTGSEGASYAMFTTVNNSASNLAGALSTLLLGVWDVSKDAMVQGRLRGMINLTWLTTAIQMSGLLFVGLLPRTKEDLANLHADPMSGSRIGGFVFLFITFSSVLYSLIVGALNIVKPGWAGES